MRQFLAEFLLVALPKVLNGLGVVLINFMAMKALLPGQFGIFSLCSVAILVSDGIIGSAFDMAVLRLAPAWRTNSPSRSYNYEVAALFLKIATATIIAMIALGASRPLSRFAFGNPDGRIYIALTALASLAMLGLRSLQLHLQVDKRFGLYGSFDLLTSLLRLSGILGVLAWYARNSHVTPSAVPLLLVLAIAPALVFLLGIATVGYRLLLPRPGWGMAVRELVRFVQWSLPTLAMTTLASRLDLLFLTGLREVEDVGIFAAAQTLTSIPELVGMYLSVIVGPRIIPTIQQGQFLKFFGRMQLGLSGVALACLLGALLGFGLVRQFLPANYARAAPLVWLLLPGALAAMVNFPLVVSFLMFFRPSFLSKVELIILPIACPLYVYAVRHHGVEGAAVVTTAVRIIKSTIHLGFAWKWAHVAHEMLPELGEATTKR